MEKTYRMTFTAKELYDLSAALGCYKSELYKQWKSAKNSICDMYNQDYSLQDFDEAYDYADHKYNQYTDTINLDDKIWKKYKKIINVANK